MVPPVNPADASQLYEHAATRARELLEHELPAEVAESVLDLLATAQHLLAAVARHYAERPSLAEKYRARERDCAQLRERVLEIYFLDAAGLAGKLWAKV